MSGDPSKGQRPWRRWAFSVIPVAGLLELGAYAMQTRPASSESDWLAARAYVQKQATSDDLIAFAPAWVDPIGRERFGSELATLPREARPDESRFPRAFEVAIRGAHVPALRGWRRAVAQRFGGVTVTTWENPVPAHVLDDLVSMVGPERLRVSFGDRECPFVRGSPQSGGLGFGPALPSDRFVCSAGSFIASSVVADLDYVPRRCIYAPSAGAGPLRLRFLGVRFGTALHGHHTLYVEAERGRQGAQVTLTFSTGNSILGTVIHKDGDGWKPFEFGTAELTDKRADLIADIASSGGRRMYCFEADTR